MKKKRISLATIALLSAISLCACKENSSDISEISNIYDSSAALPSTYTSTTDTYSKTNEESSNYEVSIEESSENKSNWRLSHYVDEFGDKSDDAYIVNSGNGTFSNSATTNSRLEYGIVIDNESFSIILYEYGSSQVKNTYSSTKQYDIKIKAGSSTLSYTGYMLSETGDRIYIIDNYQSIIGQIRLNNELSFLITVTDRPSTSYKFKVDCSGFDDVYSQL